MYFILLRVFDAKISFKQDNFIKMLKFCENKRIITVYLITYAGPM